MKDKKHEARLAMADLVVDVVDAIYAAGYVIKKGQPRQADPSGAASMSTTSEQPATPTAPSPYHSECYCVGNRHLCKHCRDSL